MVNLLRARPSQPTQEGAHNARWFYRHLYRAWRDLVVERGKDGRERVNRINDEIAVLHTLRDKLRCKELWVVGADRQRNPDDDLPADFAAGRVAYYAALHQPLEADTFIADLQRQLRTALAALDADIPTNPHVRLLPKGGGWIALSPSTRSPNRSTSHGSRPRSGGAGR